MNILYVSENFPPYTKGGAEISTSLIVKYSAKTEKCMVVTSKFQKSPWDFEGVKVIPMLKKISVSRGSIIEIIKYGLGILFLPLINIWILVNLIRKNKVDVVHFVPIEYYYAPSILAAFITKKPFIVDVRNYALVCPSSLASDYCKDHHYIKHDKCLISRYKTDNKFLKLLMPIFSFYEYFIFKLDIGIFRFALKHSPVYKIVPNSNFVKKIHAINGYDENKMQVIFNFAGDEKYKEGSASRLNRILYAGELDKSKGVWDLIFAFELLNNKNLSLEIAGDGKEKDSIEEYLQKKGLTNIKLLGKLPNADVINLYRDSKIVAAPSVWPEPFGRFILESMLVKTPIVTTNVGGIPEGVVNRKTGILVEPNDVKSLAHAIKILLEDKSLYQNVVDNLSKEVKKYSPEVIGPQRMDLYNELLSKNIT